MECAQGNSIGSDLYQSANRKFGIQPMYGNSPYTIFEPIHFILLFHCHHFFHKLDQ